MRLISINVGIKIDNAPKVAEFISGQDADFVALQEVVRHLEDSVFEMYRSKVVIESAVGESLPHRFFGPLWITEAFWKNGKIHRDFGGLIEQGNEIMSRFPIGEATNEHYYKTYSYAHDWTDFRAEDHARAVEVVEFRVGRKRLQLLNLHGIWTADKAGDKRTMKQCRYVIEAAKRKQIPTIIVGDFNLSPNTPSIRLMSREFRNLIDLFNITSTRPDFEDGLESGRCVVDYIFVNDMIKVRDFRAVDTIISDHLPLLLDFDII